jgi:hypothetical protein
MLAADSNPVMSGGTGLSFYLPTPGTVRLRIVDVAGRLVANLSQEHLSAGHHQVFWGAQDVSAGMYFAVLEIGGERQVAKLTVVH